MTRLRRIVLVSLTVSLTVLNLMMYFDVSESHNVEHEVRTEHETRVIHAIYIYEIVENDAKSEVISI